jgi:hypothetical protein
MPDQPPNYHQWASISSWTLARTYRIQCIRGSRSPCPARTGHGLGNSSIRHRSLSRIEIILFFRGWRRVRSSIQGPIAICRLLIGQLHGMPCFIIR